jgi:hypothetical protein
MAFTGALLAAFSPWGAVLAGLPLTEGLFLFVLAATFLLMKLVQEASKVAVAVSGSVLVGLLTGFNVLVKPIWPLVLLVAGALFLQYGPRRKGAWLVLTLMLASAATPLFLWEVRNIHQANFHGLSDAGGKAVWRGLAARVRAQVSGQDRFVLEKATLEEDSAWSLSVQEADTERLRRAKAVFKEHPLLTVYCFLRSVAEHTVHPSPDVLTPAKLNFKGDYWVLAGLWGGIMVLAFAGLISPPEMKPEMGQIDRSWLITLLAICLALNFSGGIAFGQGSRYRTPLELIVPLLAGIGVIRLLYYRRHHLLSVSAFIRKVSV